MSKRCFAWAALPFILVPAWKLLLFLASTQPVPANDSFFYDGPVVNLLLHGRYINPALSLALPISGTEIFSAYPPLYQLVLLVWMSVFGTSILAAMTLHLVLFGCYLAVLWAILAELETPNWCVCLGGIFLFGLTFHDRPDSLAHVFGMTGLYYWLRSKGKMNGSEPPKRGGPWVWLAAGCILLTLCTSLQLGALYGVVVAAAAVGARVFANDRLPVGPMLLVVILPAALIAWVALQYPHLWAGFLEHARQTPSLLGWHRPQLGDLLKILRTLPGSLAAICLLGCLWLTLPALERSGASTRAVVLAVGLATAAVVAGCLFIFTPNMVIFAAYLQPVLVAGTLALSAGRLSNQGWVPVMGWVFVGLGLGGAVRAIGMSTWGVVCAHDFGYRAAIACVRREATEATAGQVVVFSAAYLYEAARQDRIRWIHSDWLDRAQRGEERPEKALLKVRPAKLVLTQFDFYRRYESLLKALRTGREPVEFQVTNYARIPAPDSFASLQRVLQQISWAPVVVTFTWKAKDGL